MTHLGVRAGGEGDVRELKAAIAAGYIVNGRGEKVMNAPDAVLVREDGAAWFPVRGEIPVMIREEMLQKAE